MWAKVDDGWWCHPKVMGLGLAARGLWVSALSWSCHQREPKVPAGFLGMVGASIDEADQLVKVGLWVKADDSTGWVIHNWAEYQEKSLAEKRADAGRKGGEAKARRSDQPKRKQTSSKTDLPDVANGLAGTHPFPTHPIPTTTTKPVDHSDSTPTEPVPMVVDEQAVRACAVAVGRAIAAQDHPADPAAYAASVTRRILTGPDPTDRDRIRHDLADGLTPEAIAAGWVPAPVSHAPPPVDRPRCDDCAGTGMILGPDDDVARRCGCNPILRAVP